MLAYYWVLVTPSVAFIFGAYLYLSVNIFHVHYDEAFSSLQVPHHKGFSRIHITPEGDLHVYGLAIDQVRGPFVPSSTGTASLRTMLGLMLCAVRPSAWQSHGSLLFENSMVEIPVCPCPSLTNSREALGRGCCWH